MEPVDDDVDVVEYGARRVLVVVAVMLATLLETLDSTIVNVALPTIGGNLGASQDQGTWIVTGYIIAAVIVIPLTPWLQERFGRRAYYVAAVVGFTLASFACGVSTTIDELIAFRIVQGLFGGGLISTGTATLRDTFPRTMVAASQGLGAVGAIIGPTLGPTVGGILTDRYSWNWVFFLNVVPGAIAATLLLLFLRNPKTPRAYPVDGVGLLLLAVGLGSLQYVLNEGERYDWFDDARNVAIAALSAAGLAAFVAWESFVAKRPIVDLRILRYRTVAAGALVAAAINFNLYASIVLTPQYTQEILGFTPTLSGLAVLCRALGIFAGAPLAVVALERGIAGTWLLAGGFAVVVVETYAQSAATTSLSTLGTLWAPLFFGGFGFAFLFVPLLTTVLGSVEGPDVQKASAFTSLALNLGGSISAAFAITLVDRRSAFHFDALAAHATLANRATAGFLTHGSLASLAALVQREAQTLGYADATFVVASVTALLALSVTFIRPSAGAPVPRPRPQPAALR